MGLAFELTALNQLSHIDNGTSYCGRQIDNGVGDKYAVTLGSDEHPILAGLQGVSFLYGDDIDTSRVVGDMAQVLATATVEGRKNCDSKPVVVTYSPTDG